MSNHLIDTLSAGFHDREDSAFAHMPDGGTLRFNAFFAGAARIASLLTEIGVAPGDRVAAQTVKSIEGLQLYLGAVMAGAVFLPLNTGYKSAELAHFITDATPRVFVCDPAELSAIRALTKTDILTLDAHGHGTLTDRANACAGMAPVNRQPDDLAAILYTSGTTGKPKGAMLSHGNLATNAQALSALWRFTPDDVLIHALPVFHMHGLFVATNVALVSGAAIQFHAGFDAKAVLASMPQATAMMGVPTFYTRLLQQDGLADAARNMRLFTSGSAPLLIETHDAWAEVTGHRILERYGMTETNINASNPYDGERRAGTVGFPLPGVELRLTDGKGMALDDGEPGIIEVRGPNVFTGYWNLPEKTAEELLPDGFFITGDIGRIDDDGYLHIVGRAKDLVISGGYNVYPKEIELLIDALPGVAESAVIGVPHPDFGEGVVALVVAEGKSATTPDTISAAIAPALARYKQPKQVILVDTLPRNAMSKVQKNVLREQYATLFAK